MSNYQFRYCCGVSYHCLNCKEKFKCSKPKTKKSKEKEFKDNNKIAPTCNFCNQSHWRCQNTLCEICCELNKCNDINCSKCLENNINCKHSFPSSQQEFNLIKDKVRYLVYQFEKSKSKRLHIQFYERVTIKQVKKIFNDNSMWIKEVKGSFEDNYKYCTKEFNEKDNQGNYNIGEKSRWDDNSGPFEFGKPNKHEKNNEKNEYFSLKAEEYLKIGKVVKDLKEGKDLKKLIIENCDEIPSWCNNISGLEKINTYLNSCKIRCWTPIVIYMYGDPGTGKTEIAKEMFPNLFIKDMQLWWENYRGEEAILLDEFYGSFKYSELLRVLDKDEYRVQVKGSSVPLLAKYIILTSNRSPEKSYNFNEELKNGTPNQKDSRALERRLQYILYFKGEYNPLKNNVKIKFEKGDIENFVNGKFDIQYSKKSNETFDEYKNRVQQLNKGNQGELVIKKEDRFDILENIIYWKKDIIIPENVKNYIIKHSKKRKNNFDTNQNTKNKK